MLRFKVSGQGNLFAELVSAMIQAALPEATVNMEPPADAYAAGVHVSLDGTDRWIFVSTEHGPNAHAAQALAQGACAVLSLASRPEDFSRALDAILKDDAHHVSVEMVRWMAGATLQNVTDGEANEPVVNLTFRERQVLQLVAAGHSNAAIARTLTISANTVRSHLHALSVKLESTSRTHMLATARALGLPEASGQPAVAQRSA